jgi:hypothetical protein
VQPDGTAVTYIGSKDPSGKPTSTTQLLVEHAAGDRNQVYLDDRRRVLLAATPAGSVQYTYTSATAAVLTLRAPDGTASVQIPYDFATKKVGSVGRRVSSATRTGRLTVLNRTPSGSSIPIPAPPVTTGTVTGILHVTCGDGDPYEATEVFGDYTLPSSTTPVALEFTRTGPGQYTYRLPAKALQVVPLTSEICPTIEKYFSNLCQANDALNTVMQPFSDADKERLIAALAVFVSGGNVWIAPLLAALPKLLDRACTIQDKCDTITGVIDSALTTPTILHFGAIVNGKAGMTQVNAFPPAAGQPPIQDAVITIDVGATFTDIYASPPNPAPGQSYAIVATAACFHNGQAVTLSVHGTDGYTASETVTLTSTGGLSYPDAKLSVPGALQAGIVDTIVATLVGSSPLVQRTLTVVFQ